MQCYAKKYGWLYVSPVQPEKTQGNHSPSEMSWKNLFKGVSYVAKPNKQQNWVMASWQWHNAVVWKKHGWLFFSQVQPDKRQVNHTPSEISWKELFNGVWYVAKPFEQQKVGLGLLAMA